MYLCNHVRLDLGLEGNPDPTWEEVNLAAQALQYTGYICPEYDYTIPPEVKQAAPPHIDPAAAPVAKGGAAPATTVKQSRKG